MNPNKSKTFIYFCQKLFYLFVLLWTLELVKIKKIKIIL